MSNNIDTVGELFQCAIELENSAASLYREFGKMFAHLPEVAGFWERYADEEKGHAAYLERIKASGDTKRLSDQADVVMLQKARQCLESVTLVRLDKIKTLEDAFQLATELENSETNVIFEFIILNFSTDELAKSHQFLRTQLSTHIARLEEDFPAPYKSSIARQNALVK